MSICRSSWAGARYAITPTLDAGVAYYHYDQNSFTWGASATAPRWQAPAPAS